MAMLTQAEEIFLISRVRDDGSAFDELYNYYFPRVYNYVHYRVADSHDCDDLTSQIFEKLFSRFKYYQPGRATFSAWLFSIARHTVVDYYRSQARMRDTSLEITIELIDSKPEPSDIVAFNETQQHLLKALESLTQREREIIALKFWSGSSNRDIATLIEVSESNIAVILFRAMRRLRTILEARGMSVNG